MNVREGANQSVEVFHGSGRTMIMNERVEIEGGRPNGRTASGVDEKLIVLHRTLKLPYGISSLIFLA